MRRGSLCWVLALAACGGGPTLADLRCRDGEAACQAPHDPYSLRLAVDFEDADGDLGRGLAHVLVDGVRHQTLPAARLFDESGVPLDATSGTLQLHLDLSLPDTRPGGRFEVGVEVEDAAGNLSNDPSIEFEITAP